MTAYRSSKPYRSSERYRPSKGGVYTTPALSRSFAVSANTAVSVNSHSIAGWARVAHLSECARLAWDIAQPKDAPLVAPWGKAEARSDDTALAWQEAEKQNRLFVVGWGKAMALTSKGGALAWELANPLDTDSVAYWGAPDPLATVYSTKWLMISHRHIADDYRTNKPYRSFWRYVERRQRITHNTYSRAPWSATSAHKSDLETPWGGGFAIWGTDRPINWDSDTSPIPDKEPPPQPEVKEFYDMATDLSVVDVETNTPLAIEGVTMSLDIDSFAWSFSGTAFNQSSMNLAQPGKEIKISTMGYEWVFLTELYTKSRGVANEWALRGASLSKALDSPWQRKRTHAETAPTTYKQAIESLLPLGWTALFSKIDDYTIPAGAWSYSDKTPLESISDLLSALGAVVIPDLSQKTLHIQPRYKYAPWEYFSETTEPDAIVHESMILGESGQYRPGIKTNGQLVSGTSMHGVVVEAMRAGTDGHPFADDFYHPLITDTVAAAQRSKQTAAASGNKMLVSLDTVITDYQASPGLVLPGYLVEVVGEQETWRGICLSVHVSGAGLPEITQTIVIERDLEG